MGETTIKYEPEFSYILKENKQIADLIVDGDVLLKTLTAESIEYKPKYCADTVDYCLYFFNKAKKIARTEIINEYERGIVNNYCNKRIREVGVAKEEVNRRSPKISVDELTRNP